jgi:hypothetical protein
MSKNMKLRQVSPGDPVSALGLEAFEIGAPIIQDAEFRAEPGDLERDEKLTDAEGNTTITRALNADNTPVTYTPSFINVTKKIVSKDIKVDKSLEQRGKDIESVLARRTKREMTKVARLFQAMCFNGDSGSVATNFDGFENLVATYGTIKTGGLALPVGGDDFKEMQQEAIEILLEHAEYVQTFAKNGLIHAYCNGKLKVRLLTVSKNLGYLTTVQRPGEPGAVDNIIGDKIILRSAGLNYSGSAYLLPFTETGDASSIWFISWDEEGEGVHLLTSAGLVGEYNGRVGNFYQNNFNMYAVIGCRHPNSLVRSTGWKLS